MTVKKRILIVGTHLARDRRIPPERNILQSTAALHIGSWIDRNKYDVRIHQESHQGPYDTSRSNHFDLVFLSGLQKDFDRMRQLSYFFRRDGSTVVAGGSICTLYPEFAKSFFDVVCCGSVDSIPSVLRDHEHGQLRRVYRVPSRVVGEYELDYTLLRQRNLRGPLHLVEASRGCDYHCAFCTMPAEKAWHTPFKIQTVVNAMDSSRRSYPMWSPFRHYPVFLFVDNHFTNNTTHTRALCNKLRELPWVKAWGALVSQDVLHKRDMMRMMKRSKCCALFTGLESLDEEFLANHRKGQNLKFQSQLMDDIAFVQRLGIVVNFGLLFDPRISKVAEMAQQIATVASKRVLLYPSFFSVVAPLLGTETFQESAARQELIPNLRLRDLDGTSIAYRKTASSLNELSDFCKLIFSNPARITSPASLIAKSLHTLRDNAYTHPLQWALVLGINFRPIILGRRHAGARRTYIGGADVLDPQYEYYPADISRDDYERYFSPVMVTDNNGALAPWLRPYVQVGKDTAA
jgi:radical SAM superfamily enzyme YgiQ (UPF0313 family)